MIPAGLLPPRAPEAHKGDVGHVFVIAGSVGLTGAAALCSLAALRAGAGLVTLGVPESLNDLMEIKLTEVMTRPFPETKARSFSLQALPALVSVIERMEVVAIGPGVSQEPQTKQLVRQLLPKITKSCVLDADALNAVAEDVPLLKRLLGPMILTPHPGEMGRLIRLSAQDVQRDRERIAKEFAMKYDKVLVLKGHRTVVSNVDGELYVNDTGNPGMASGGCGDVLTGMIAGLLAQRLSLFDAARLGVYLHGLAGDLAAGQVERAAALDTSSVGSSSATDTPSPERILPARSPAEKVPARSRGVVGLIASDLLDTIPLAIRQYQSLA